jgi:Ni/Co efflux regulator RcnB
MTFNIAPKLTAAAIALSLAGGVAVAADANAAGAAGAFQIAKRDDDSDRNSRRHRGQPQHEQGDRSRDGRSGPDHRANDTRDERRTGWDRYRRNYDAPRRYRVAAYRAPRGYRYVRWSHGQRLPAVYLAHEFWLINFGLFGLFAPPPGLVWVRYGPDALLVDMYTGEIVQVRYNAFY